MKRLNWEFRTKELPVGHGGHSPRSPRRWGSAALLTKPTKHPRAGSHPARIYPEDAPPNRESCAGPPLAPQMLDSREILFCLTCSMCAFSEVSSSMLYLARIFRMGRSFSHHCSLGMRCLRGGRGRREPPAALPAFLLLLLPGPGGLRGGHLLEICLLLELGDGLEDEAALAHAQQAG